MYEVEVEIIFPASHQVNLAGGEFEPLHEHNWRVRADLAGEKLSPDGLLVDFTIVKQLLEQIADNLHGRDLTQVAALAGESPSAENVARYFYEQLKGRFAPDVRLIAVTVQEAPGCWATYRP